MKVPNMTGARRRAAAALETQNLSRPATGPVRQGKWGLAERSLQLKMLVRCGLSTIIIGFIFIHKETMLWNWGLIFTIWLLTAEYLFLWPTSRIACKPPYKRWFWGANGALVLGVIMLVNAIHYHPAHFEVVKLRLPTVPEDLRQLNHFIGDVGMMERLRLGFSGNDSSLLLSPPTVFRNEFSIIIAARDEDDYLSKTIKFTVDNTPASVIREIIVVDDGSGNPQSDLLEKELEPRYLSLVKVIRFDQKQGLIRARIAGADVAAADNIFFLDGHCKPKPGWHTPLLSSLKQNYKRIACPVIEDMNGEDWSDKGTSGTKMMFSWNFEFDWYDDAAPEVPLAAGGIIALTKRWWVEGGKYDPGMREWGGENLEQSMRTWMCGGEILVEKESHVGHIFSRPAKPNPGNRLVRQVQTNQKRAALVWLDEYYTYFEQEHPVVKTIDEGFGLEERMQLRKRLNCKPFEWYVQRFRTAFERKGMLFQHFHNLQHGESKQCIEGGETNIYPFACAPARRQQQWQPVAGGRMLYHRNTGKCLDMTGGFVDGAPVKLWACDWYHVFRMQNPNQFWLVAEGRVFHPAALDHATVDGNDYVVFPKSLARDPSSWCLAVGPGREEIVVRSCSDDRVLEWNWLW